MKNYIGVNKKKYKTRIKFILVIFVLLIIGVFCYLHFVVDPVILDISTSKTKTLAQKAIDNVILDIITDNPLYDKLISLQRDKQGNIVLISTNTHQVNLLSRQVSQKAQTELSELGASGIMVPAGAFSGLPIFSGKGPPVTIKIMPIGIITCTFKSEFVTAGINQTNHRIFINVTSDVTVILPTSTHIVKTETQLLISESIIIGKVPETYLNSNKLDEMLNLIP